MCDNSALPPSLALQLPALLSEAPVQPPYAELVSRSEDAVLKQMQVRLPFG